MATANFPKARAGARCRAQVQTSTSCARNPIALDKLPYRVVRLRGGAIAVSYEATAVDVGTGNRNVTVYTELELMSAALREVRRRSQPSPEPLPPPVYPEIVLRELKRVTAAADRLHSGCASSPSPPTNWAWPTPPASTG